MLPVLEICECDHVYWLFANLDAIFWHSVKAVYINL